MIQRGNKLPELKARRELQEPHMASGWVIKTLHVSWIYYNVFRSWALGGARTKHRRCRGCLGWFFYLQTYNLFSQNSCEYSIQLNLNLLKVYKVYKDGQ